MGKHARKIKLAVISVEVPCIVTGRKTSKKADKNMQEKCKHARMIKLAVISVEVPYIVTGRKISKKADKNVQEKRKHVRKVAVGTVVGVCMVYALMARKTSKKADKNVQDLAVISVEVPYIVMGRKTSKKADKNVQEKRKHARKVAVGTVVGVCMVCALMASFPNNYISEGTIHFRLYFIPLDSALKI